MSGPRNIASKWRIGNLGNLAPELTLRTTPSTASPSKIVFGSKRSLSSRERYMSSFFQTLRLVLYEHLKGCWPEARADNSFGGSNRLGFELEGMRLYD